MDLPHRQLLETAPDAMVVVDTDGKLVLINEQTEALFGYPRHELIGNAVEMLLPERYREAHPAHRQNFLVAPGCRQMAQGQALFGRRRNGEEFPIEIRLSAVETAQRKLISGTIREVEAHIEAEKVLLEAKELAESSSAAKSRFLAAASHDLRQPLQSLGLYLSVMKRQLEDPLLLNVAAKMNQSLEAMGDLLDALLDISKLDAGTIEPDVRDVHLKGLLERIVTDNIQQAQQKGLQLDLVGADCRVRSDPVLLERIVENYVTNAIRYTERGRVCIQCECTDGSARIRVSDTGIGIPDAEVGKVFDEYYQLDNPLRNRRQGLGLGLSIVKQIARILNHPISVVSTPGEGSTFTVEVPLCATQSVERPIAVAGRASSGRRHEPVVLFVDTDRTIVDAMTDPLKSAGIEVHCVFNGNEALAHMENGVRPDIVVSNDRPPASDGVDIVRRIRQKTSSELPTIIMTGDRSTSEVQAAALPNCTVVHKPVDADKLVTLIETLSV